MTGKRHSLESTSEPDIEEIKANEPVRSRSNAPSMSDLLQARLNRRTALCGGVGLAATTLFSGAGVAGTLKAGTGAGADDDTGRELTFNSVSVSVADKVIVPEGYVADVTIPWGTPILPDAAPFDPANNTWKDQAGQIGDHHDGMYFFQKSGTPDNEGLITVNHENITRKFMFPSGRDVDADGRPTDPDQIRREMAAHGVSVTKLVRSNDGRWSHQMSDFNRRITAMTEIAISGPAAGSSLMVTPYSPQGKKTRGTLNNCGRGYTPWHTYLTSEENFQGYFTSRVADEEISRYGITETGWGFFWAAVADAVPEDEKGMFARFDITPTSANATEDWRNEARHFGWVVEIDPYDPTSTPKKRTAMGRFRHEGCQPSIIEKGKPIAFYMGDDNNGEYCYKFVTQDNWDPDNPVPDMLDRGTLYVARFNNDGTGAWLPLDVEQSPVLAKAFADQAELLVKTRIAADLVNPTKMDRPEWSAVDPITGDVYYTLTNNAARGDHGEEPLNAANPRPDNTYGHIIRQEEAGRHPAATAFTWDIFVFGAPSGADADVNISGLTRANQFGSPDGLFFDSRGVMWISTDNHATNDVGEVTNNQLLAVIPASLSGDQLIRPETQASLKRFLIGPDGCEITGTAMAEDNKTLFNNVMHPMNNFPNYSPNIPPRSATMAIRRRDGGVVAL